MPLSPYLLSSTQLGIDVLESESYQLEPPPSYQTACFDPLTLLHHHLYPPLEMLCVPLN